LEFYKKVLGAETTFVVRFKDSPDPSMCPTDDANKIMHSSFRVAKQLCWRAMAVVQEGKLPRISLSIRANDESEATRIFNGLANGGQVQMPQTKTFFSPLFGMVADRFGVTWMVLV